MSALDLFKKLVRDQERDSADGEGSTIIRDNEIVRQFISNPTNTLLVSFPRTGSHWLRMLMELYFERPTLKLVFYYPKVTDYIAYHTHDLDLDMEHPTALYLYRDPVDTIYSQLSYHKEALNNTERIVYWADLYGRHLDKWLHTEKFSTKKTILRYEGLKQDLPTEFAKVAQHFGFELDSQKLVRIAAATTKEETKRKTTHDQQVVNLKKGYTNGRNDFYRHSSEIVWDALLKDRPHLKEDFQD